MGKRIIIKGASFSANSIDRVSPSVTYYSVIYSLGNCTASNSATSIAAGSTYQVTITAKSGYTIRSVTVKHNGVTVNPSSGYTYVINNVSGNITVTATATADVVNYTVTYDLVHATASNNATTVTKGSSYSVTLSPASGYVISSATVTHNGSEITPTSGYTFDIPSVSGNILVECVAVAESVNTYKVTYNLTNVTSSNPATSVQAGGSYSFTLTPDSGCVMGSVVVTHNGQTVMPTGSGYTYSISSVSGNIEVTASAAQEQAGTYTITLIISNADKAWQDIIQSNQTDEAVNKHYAQFKQYTAEHYFSTSLTGNYLYQILGSINTSKRFRTEFWSWYHKEGGGYDLFHTEENFDNFKNALKSLWGNLAINDEQQGYLNTFLKAAEEGRKIATRGGVNWGHVAEAFERHLEEHHGFGENGLPQKDKYKDFRDYYPNTDEPHLQKDWVQHLLLSQGKLPGYFGPDTEYAQIKQFSTKGGSLNVININQLVHARVYLLKILSLIQKGEDLIKYSQNLQRQYAMDMNAMDQMGKDLETHIIKELQ